MTASCARKADRIANGFNSKLESYPQGVLSARPVKRVVSATGSASLQQQHADVSNRGQAPNRLGE
jgi:hypothetical protein